MPARTLDVALWDYRDHDGRRRRAYYGQRFALTDSEIERGEQAGVFVPEHQPNPTTASIEGFDVQSEQPAEPANTPLICADRRNDETPRHTALKAAWVEYAITRGLDRATADSMTKQQLVATYPLTQQTSCDTTPHDMDIPKCSALQHHSIFENRCNTTTSNPTAITKQAATQAHSDPQKY